MSSSSTSVNLEANVVYRVLVWDIEHFDHHLQSVGTAPGRLPF